MKSSIAQTALMGLTAAALSAIAAWFYPWPENVTQSDLVGKPLFESFEANDVRRITVTEYDIERNGLKQIELRRNGDLWIVPAKQNFIADNPTQISLAINSVNTNVLEQRSNDLQDHVEYGVVDPLEFESTPVRNRLGKKIVLQDRNNRELASLIVGSSPQDDTNQSQRRRFVRISGKPGVYVVELPYEALASNFTHWVETNLMNITDGSDLNTVTINHYQAMQPETPPDSRKKEWNYQLTLDMKNQKRIAKVPGDDGELKEVELPESNLAAINQLGMFLTNTQFLDVRKKSRPIATLLKNPNASDVDQLKGLVESGFYAVSHEPERTFGLNFEAVRGDVTVQSLDGVSVTLLVGNLAEGAIGDSSDLNRLVMLYASFDENLIPAPAKSEAEDEESQKAYLRQVAERNSKLVEGRKRAQSLNDQFADWYYVVPERVIEGLFPDLKFE